MEKIVVNVPKGIRYISEWEEFKLPDYPCIINKSITGCGFTEWCIRNNQNVILCSPRRILLENKEEQHPGELLYVRNELDKVLEVDKDLSASKNSSSDETVMSVLDSDKLRESIDYIHLEVKNYYMICQKNQRPCKLTVTYDSYRHLVDALGDSIKNFYIIVDEFQSIFTDSRFKSSTEIEFLNHLQGIDRLCFVSATPMMDKYLDMLDEFKDLPYIELNWGALDPSRIIKPQLIVKACHSIISVASEVIKTYQAGNFQKFTYQDDQGVFQEIESKELVIYVNSVKNICDIIKKCELNINNTNVLCSKTPDNEKKIRKAFGLKKNEIGIGSVPVYGQSRKMFTLCTRTVYLGADFYSDNARSIILSDANIECLAVDITLDLPQILGRQRLNENPWKNRAELYFKSTLKSKRASSFNEFAEMIQQKRENTKNLLLAYSQVSDPQAKHMLTVNYQYVAKSKNYKDDYVSVNTHGGKDLFPVFNNLVMVSELRAFEVQQIDYRDRFTVFNLLREGDCEINDNVENFLHEFDSLCQFTDKMKFLCDSNFLERDLDDILNCIPLIFKNYYITLGPEKIKALSYQKSKLDLEYENQKLIQITGSNLEEAIYSEFKVGEKYLKSDIKSKLKDLYSSFNISSTPKSTDLDKYFILERSRVSVEGKQCEGYKLIGKK